jgi:hypothetical protein
MIDESHLEGDWASFPVCSVNCRKPSGAYRDEILDLVARNGNSYASSIKKRAGL